MKKEMIEKYGGIRSRNGNDNDKPLGDRFVDQNIIKKWDNEARAKLKLLKNEKEKEQIKAWLSMSDEEKKA